MRYIIAISAFIIVSMGLKIYHQNAQIREFIAKFALICDEAKRCKAEISKQNDEIMALTIKAQPKEPKIITQIEKIKIKDANCESELKAYKELFGSKND